MLRGRDEGGAGRRSEHGGRDRGRGRGEGEVVVVRADVGQTRKVPAEFDLRRKPGADLTSSNRARRAHNAHAHQLNHIS